MKFVYDSIFPVLCYTNIIMSNKTINFAKFKKIADFIATVSLISRVAEKSFHKYILWSFRPTDAALCREAAPFLEANYSISSRQEQADKIKSCGGMTPSARNPTEEL